MFYEISCNPIHLNVKPSVWTLSLEGRWFFIPSLFRKVSPTICL